MAEVVGAALAGPPELGLANLLSGQHCRVIIAEYCRALRSIALQSFVIGTSSLPKHVTSLGSGCITTAAGQEGRERVESMPLILVAR